jgi:hypothetical protein
VLRAPGEVQGKRAVIAETVECAPPRDLSHEHAVLALIEECAGLLTGPRCGEVAHSVLHDLDLVRHGPVEEYGFAREPFARAERRIVPRQYPFGTRQLDQCLYDDLAECLESGAHELDHEPAVIPVDHQRRQPIAFSVYEAIGVRDVGQVAPTLDGHAELGAPPTGAYRGGAGIEPAERDFRRWTPQRRSKRASTPVLDVHRARLGVGKPGDVAPVDPRMAMRPARRAALGDNCGREYHGEHGIALQHGAPQRLVQPRAGRGVDGASRRSYYIPPAAAKPDALGGPASSALTTS